MFGLYTVKDCGGHNFERLAVSFYGSYKWFKTIFRILRHDTFTRPRPQLIRENHEISPTLLIKVYVSLLCIARKPFFMGTLNSKVFCLVIIFQTSKFKTRFCKICNQILAGSVFHFRNSNLVLRLWNK